MKLCSEWGKRNRMSIRELDQPWVLVSVNLHRGKWKVKKVRREGAAMGMEAVPEAAGLLFLCFQ